VDDKAAFEHALHAMFDRHQAGGRIELRYRIVVLCWTQG
jgi:hypothetical protein